MSEATPFSLDAAVPVRGLLHVPAKPSGNGLVLSHGAGGDCRSALLAAVAEGFVTDGWHVLRIDLPFRQAGRAPNPSQAVRDREGIRCAIDALREHAPAIYAGGLSYGGRQTSMLAAESPGLIAGLLLLSYPLHPPGKPQQLRTAHLPALNLPCLFVHGTKDPFGTIEEVEEAMKLLPGRTRLLTCHGAGHDLGKAKKFLELFLELPHRLLSLA